MTLKWQHPYTLIIAGPSSCGKYTFVVILLVCGDNFFTLCLKILCGVMLKATPQNHLKIVSFPECVQDFENPDNVPTLILLDVLMYSNFSTNLSQILT